LQVTRANCRFPPRIAVHPERRRNKATIKLLDTDRLKDETAALYRRRNARPSNCFGTAGDHVGEGGAFARWAEFSGDTLGIQPISSASL
jgi:hypothetical protein